MNEDLDQPVPVGADDAFEPIVESLLRWPLDSPQYAAAAEVAGQAEVAEAQRQLDQQIDAHEERRAWLERQLEA